MADKEPPINLDEIREMVWNLEKYGFIVVDNQTGLTYSNMETKIKMLLVWTSREKAQRFIDDNLVPEESKVEEYLMPNLCYKAIDLGFHWLVLNPVGKVVDQQQKFLYYDLSDFFAKGLSQTPILS